MQPQTYAAIRSSVKEATQRGYLPEDWNLPERLLEALRALPEVSERYKPRSLEYLVETALWLLADIACAHGLPESTQMVRAYFSVQHSSDHRKETFCSYLDAKTIALGLRDNPDEIKELHTLFRCAAYLVRYTNTGVPQENVGTFTAFIVIATHHRRRFPASKERHDRITTLLRQLTTLF